MLFFVPKVSSGLVGLLGQGVPRTCPSPCVEASGLIGGLVLAVGGMLDGTHGTCVFSEERFVPVQYFFSFFCSETI